VIKTLKIGSVLFSFNKFKKKIKSCALGPQETIQHMACYICALIVNC